MKHASKTVLLVDDDATLRKLLGRALADGGHAVLTAADGQEALAVASTLGHQLGLVVTDIRMPEMDGLELANHLAQLVPPPPVLFITGFAAAAATAIPGPVLEKPFSPDQLLQRVALLLRLSTVEMPPEPSV